jgi:hypothetical protein
MAGSAAPLHVLNKLQKTQDSAQFQRLKQPVVGRVTVSGIKYTALFEGKKLGSKRFGSVQASTRRAAADIQKIRFGACKHKVWSCGYNLRIGGRKAGGDVTSWTVQARLALHAQRGVRNKQTKRTKKEEGRTLRQENT